MKKRFVIVTVIAALLLVSVGAMAQKGSGNKSGVARGVLPPVEFLSGTILEVHVGPCLDATAGNFPIGMHFIVQTSTGTEINLHLGPERAVRAIVSSVSVGQTISFEAFTTFDLPINAYIAKALFVGNQIIQLRDDALRPFWAR